MARSHESSTRRGRLGQFVVGLGREPTEEEREVFERGQLGEREHPQRLELDAVPGRELELAQANQTRRRESLVGRVEA